MKNPKVDFFFKDGQEWNREFSRLREIALGCGLDEELKWGKPCYCLEGRNVVLIHGFKNYCAMLFIKGALLKDRKKILIQQTENVQAGRQLRFTKLQEILDSEKTIREYILEAIEVEKAGLSVELKSADDYPMPPELRNRLAADPALKEAFEALSPGRRKGYMYYISQAKQPKTREARVEKSLPRILDGLGMDD